MGNKKVEETKGINKPPCGLFQTIDNASNFPGKFVAIPSGGPASRGASVAVDEDGGNGCVEKFAQYHNYYTKKIALIVQIFT